MKRKDEKFLNSVPPTITLGRDDLSPEGVKLKSIYIPSWRAGGYAPKPTYLKYCKEVRHS